MNWPRIKSELLYGPYDQAQALMALVALLWGARILHPSDSFLSAEHYGLLARIAPEWFWGLLLLLLAAFKVLTLLFVREGGASRAAAVGAGVWFCLGAAFTVSNPHAASNMPFAGFFLASVWVAWRAGKRGRG